MSERGAESLTVKALETVGRYRMMRENSCVVVALSGGADSMALLGFLMEQRQTLGLSGIYAVHVHHGLRGEEADRDEEFVRQECTRLGVELTVIHEDVRRRALERGEGLEEAGRRVRYEVLTQRAAQVHGCIATAHTLSDSMETVLLHMTRGCGLRGLCGIPPVRREGNVTVIRPLINCTRAEVEAYCEQQGLPFIYDTTNGDKTYSRNRLRLEVVPALTQINPAVSLAFSRLMNHAREDGELLDELAAQALREAAFPQEQYGGYAADKLAALPPSLRKRALEGAVNAGRQQGEPISLSDKQQELLDKLLVAGGELTINADTHVRVSQGRLTVFCPRNVTRRKISPLNGKDNRLNPHQNCLFYGRMYLPRLISLTEFEKQKKIHKNVLNNSFNYDKIAGKLRIRSRQPGDAYCPAGRGVKKSLKKLFGEAKVPAEQRNGIPIVCDEQGIVLVGGFGCDERVRIDSSATQILVLECV